LIFQLRHISAFGSGINDYLRIDRSTDSGYNSNILYAHLVNNNIYLKDTWVDGNLIAPDDIVNCDGWARHPYWYEVTRNGQQITFRISYDGINYNEVFSTTMTVPVDATQRVAIGGTVWATAGSYVDWDYINVEPIGTTDVPEFPTIALC